MAIVVGGETGECGVLQTKKRKYFKEKRMISFIRYYSLVPFNQV